MSRSRAYGELDEPVYAGIGFSLQSGPTTLELKQHVRADGTVIQYHSARFYGPYSTRGPASAAIKWYKDQIAAGSNTYDWDVVESTGWKSSPPKVK